jgi:hypothetical protein
VAARLRKRPVGAPVARKSDQNTQTDMPADCSAGACCVQKLDVSQVLRIAPRFASRCVLHRYENQMIPCRQLCTVCSCLKHLLFRIAPPSHHHHHTITITPQYPTLHYSLHTTHFSVDRCMDAKCMMHDVRIDRCMYNRSIDGRHGSEDSQNSPAGAVLRRRTARTPLMIHTQVHIRVPCYDFYFL